MRVICLSKIRNVIIIISIHSWVPIDPTGSWDFVVEVQDRGRCILSEGIIVDNSQSL